MHIVESITGTFKQVTLTYVGDLLYPFVEGTSPHSYISKWLPNNLTGLLEAKQQKNQLHFGTASIVYQYILILAFLGMVYLLMAKLPMEWKWYLLILIIVILANAYVTATFANVIGRLNARVIWVLPFLVMIFTQKRLFERLKKR